LKFKSRYHNQIGQSLCQQNLTQPANKVLALVLSSIPIIPKLPNNHKLPLRSPPAEIRSRLCISARTSSASVCHSSNSFQGFKNSRLLYFVTNLAKIYQNLYNFKFYFIILLLITGVFEEF
jgi:hypothetical protein